MSDLEGYQLLRELENGPTGSVWEALDRQLGHRVAVHQVPEGAPAEAAERFLNEAEKVGRLAHPHLVAVQHRTERALVAELLTGRPAAADDLGRLLVQAQQAFLGLQAAHAVGVVHWALKPERLLATEQGGLKLTGFGTAYLAPAVQTGNAPYLAPEQWRQVPADGRADLYALGCSLFHLVTSQLPYSGGSAEELMHRHLNDPVPSAAPYRPGLPPALDALLRELMAKDPADRPADAATVRTRLGAIAADYHGQADRRAPAASYPLAPAPATGYPPATYPPAPAPAYPSAPGPAATYPSAPGPAPASVPAGPEAAGVLRGQVDQAWAYGEAGHPQEAVRMLTGLTVEAARTLGPQAPQTLQIAYDLAIWRGMADDVAGAAGLLADLVPLMTAALGPGDEDVAKATRDLWSYRSDLERRRNRPNSIARPGELAALLGLPTYHLPT
ncbi:serine/threonine-protein kinase [Streptomyces tateyamensis]|nr:serine/threonine-protein kinase [Streptomyces tateyamensis]